jgi:hypothetical protein
MASQLLYRGVAYDRSHQELPSPQPVAHVYRGNRYSVPLLHQADHSKNGVELHYRGGTYHHGANLG